MTHRTRRNALLVYPEFPPSFWAQNYLLKMVGKRTGAPPLGLLTVAAMFPEHWDLKVVDMNVEPLTDEHLDWADGVFTSTMIVQQHSLREVIARCNERKVPVVAGGPYPTSFHDEIAGVDHFVLDEVEESFPRFLELFEAGTAPHVFRTPTRPDIANAPLPRFDLIDLSLYGTMAGEEGVHTIYLSGGSAKIPGLAAILDTRLGVPVRLAEPFRGFSVPRSVDKDFLNDSALAFAVAAGLSIRRPADK